MSDDLIRRSDAIDEIRKECQALHSLGFIPLATVGGMVDAINHAPTIEPKRGEWIRSSDIDIAWGSKVYTCSNCGHKRNSKTNFCPNCGADMREREGE